MKVPKSWKVEEVLPMGLVEAFPDRVHQALDILMRHMITLEHEIAFIKGDLESLRKIIQEWDGEI